jgi:hypothetical protein
MKKKRASLLKLVLCKNLVMVTILKNVRTFGFLHTSALFGRQTTVHVCPKKLAQKGAQFEHDVEITFNRREPNLRLTRRTQPASFAIFYAKISFQIL